MAEPLEIRIGLMKGLGIVLAAILVLLGGLWLIYSFLLGDIRSNIADMKDDLGEIRSYSQNNTSKDHEVEVDLRGAVGGLSSDLREISARLDEISTSLNTLNGRAETANQILIEATQRQALFEQWVLVRLGVSSEGTIPLSWSSNQAQILEKLSTGPNPLQSWEDFYNRQ